VLFSLSFHREMANTNFAISTRVALCNFCTGSFLFPDKLRNVAWIIYYPVSSSSDCIRGPSGAFDRVHICLAAGKQSNLDWMVFDAGI
jgi:hypothetical protein